MNEFENLEAELKNLQPLPPSNDLKLRMENALGNAGKLAMRQLPGEGDDSFASKFTNIPPKKESFFAGRLLLFTGFAGFGLAALWVALFYLSGILVPETKPHGDVSDNLVAQSLPTTSTTGVSEDPDSPVHGLTLDQLQDISSMPVSGWSDPQSSERFLRMVDEGIFERPGGVPARKVRHYYIDETRWSHPASDMQILSTSPREEVIFIELDTY